MKIVLIHGQNHKGSSYHIGRMIADKINTAKEVTEFFLPKDLNYFCLGCYNCIEDESKCPFYVKKKKIMDAVEQADLLIFTTPTYCMRASAPMKSFMDLTFTYWMVHKPRKCMFSKKAIVVSTAAGRGTKSAIKDITNTLLYWGVPYIRTYGISVQSMNWAQVPEKRKIQIQSDTDRIAKIFSEEQKTRVGIKTKLLFNMMRMMQKVGWGSSPVEKEYWESNGWLAKERPWNNKL
ncbi:NADPH-dependent FMN reductase [Clostridium bornimense]|uniref:NADPH-dependent FMN reductase n=1 Tax=Clostridium bornimense TaxID=1216932 RepID=W6S7M1_9CLOT|nr:NAD(P)H-dependent oxidoreductase [Clostridium bornimense]CDM70392.1 NADPH-dependent FMN reductase [Clostridium bornimense]